MDRKPSIVTDTNRLEPSGFAAEDWQQPLTDLLADLSKTQDELLNVLTRKRELLVAGDRAGLADLQGEEARLAKQLQQCQHRRQSLLDDAADGGQPVKDLQALAEKLPATARASLRPQVRKARSRARILQHQSLTNWVLVQRTLLHLSQMIEIVATGGEKPPTYEKSGPSTSGGVLMDRAV